MSKQLGLQIRREPDARTVWTLGRSAAQRLQPPPGIDDRLIESSHFQSGVHCPIDRSSVKRVVHLAGRSPIGEIPPGLDACFKQHARIHAPQFRFRVRGSETRLKERLHRDRAIRAGEVEGPSETRRCRVENESGEIPRVDELNRKVGGPRSDDCTASGDAVQPPGKATDVREG